jgi:predicted CXXCH cytochrome family protein
MTRARIPQPLALLLLSILVGTAGCVDERVVFRDRPILEDLPTEAQGFVGYSDLDRGVTVCGNCHVGRQGDWKQTAHADAWATLQASASPQAFCEACHTVSSRGNMVTETNVGWVATANPRYQDVQCEACHGPGLDHVTQPDSPGSQPLAFISLGEGVDLGCAQCHSGVHRPFAEEWADSGHGNLNDSPIGRPTCEACHEGKGALLAWGVKATFSPQDEAGPVPITCAVCHDPHDARHDGQLRFSVTAPAVEQNLCMKCHSQRGEPDMASFRAPHAPEGPLLLGIGGWWPPNLEYSPGDILGTHGTEANPRLCAGCHVTDYQMTDDEGGFVFRATGHSFEAIPCVDGDGIPTGAETCALTERSFRSCTDGCHGSEAAARSILIVVRQRIDNLIATIEPLLAEIPEGEFAQPGRYTTADGARFNLQLAQKAGSEVHNPFLIEALLVASIRQIGIDYGISPSSGEVSLELQLGPD